MNQPENIEIFNRICIVTLNKLYSTFPVRVEIDINSIAIQAIPEKASFDETWDILEVGGEVISFLAEEGFLKYTDQIPNESFFSNVRLTMKGLAVLGCEPLSRDRTSSIISEIQGVVASGVKEAGSDAVRNIVNKLFSYAIASAPTIAASLIK